MVRRVAVMYLLFMTCTPVFAGPKEDALAAYHRFFELFTTDNHDQVAALFAPDALFYGTGSPEVVTTPEGIRQYFVGALTGKRGTVKATPFAQTQRWSYRTASSPYRVNGSRSGHWMERWLPQVRPETLS
jgi:SnoaL-like domain